jgi:hypothetical protein
MSRRRTLLGVLVLAAASLVGVATPAYAIDESPPQINFTTAVKPVLGTLLSDSTSRPSLSATVAWSAYDPSGVTYQYAQVYNYDTRSWTYVSLTGSQRSFDYRFRVGTSYRVALWTQDALGNGAWSYTYPYFSLAQEGAASYSAGWSTGSCACWSGGAVVKNSKAGATATYSFYGSSIAYIGDRASDRGSARIYIDGVLRATVNMQGSTKANRLIASSRIFASSGSHTIRVEVVGTAGHPRVDVDAFVVGS